MAVITLNSIQDKVRAMEGTQRTTPITMSDLNGRISKLEENKTEIIRIPFTHMQGFKIPPQYKGYNLALISCNIELLGEGIGQLVLKISKGKEIIFDTTNYKDFKMTIIGDYLKLIYISGGDNYYDRDFNGVTWAEFLFYK